MRVLRFSGNVPHVGLSIGFWGQAKFRFDNQIDDFRGRQKVAIIEIDSSILRPGDSLPYRESLNNVLSILEKSMLNSALVVVEDRTILPKNTHHGSEAFTLPLDIFIVGHVVAVAFVSIE